MLQTDQHLLASRNEELRKWLWKKISYIRYGRKGGSLTIDHNNNTFCELECKNVYVAV